MGAYGTCQNRKLKHSCHWCVIFGIIPYYHKALWWLCLGLECSFQSYEALWNLTRESRLDYTSKVIWNVGSNGFSCWNSAWHKGKVNYCKVENMKQERQRLIVSLLSADSVRREGQSISGKDMNRLPKISEKGKNVLPYCCTRHSHNWLEKVCGCCLPINP